MTERQRGARWLALLLGGIVALVVLLILVQPRPAPKPKVAAIPPNAPVFEDFSQVPTAPTPPVPAPSPTTGLALIVDDIGYDRRALERLLALHIPLAISVLPDAPLAGESARRAHRAGQLVMLHLPMQPDNPYLAAHMSPAFLRVGMAREEVRKVFEQDLARVPFAVGVNNHMGSRLTRERPLMQWVMELCREHGLFFVDSRTHKDSVAAQVAREAGIVWGSRRLFLDHRTDPDSLRRAWQRALACAEHARCILIAHPHPETVRFLETVVQASSQLPTFLSLDRALHPAS